MKNDKMGRPVVPIDRRPFCPECRSNVVYIKTLTKEIVCRRCGSISPLGKKVSDDKKNKA